MGWGLGWDSTWKRDIGYGVPAWCDHPVCTAVIDRGLSYVCANEEPYGGDDGCGLYFCYKHGAGSQCVRCEKKKKSFAAKPDHPDWLKWKLEDKSWAEWRAENPRTVEAMRAEVARR